jgi:hypothetical protein
MRCAGLSRVLRPASIGDSHRGDGAMPGFSVQERGRGGWSSARRRRGRDRPLVRCGLVALALAATPAAAASRKAKPAAEDAPSPALRERIAALALKQVAFGSVSLLPVHFDGSRLAGPIEDGGRVIYCVSGRMYGRTFGKPERPKVALRYEADRLTVLDDDEVCTGHRTQPFPELDALGNKP